MLERASRQCACPLVDDEWGAGVVEEPATSRFAGACISSSVRRARSSAPRLVRNVLIAAGQRRLRMVATVTFGAQAFRKCTERHAG